MLFKPLKSQTIHLEGRETLEFDAGEGVILVPGPNAKVFIHWLTESGKIRQTYTMNYDTQISSKVRLINGLTDPIDIHVIQIG